jgi:hypothetical protein
MAKELAAPMINPITRLTPMGWPHFPLRHALASGLISELLRNLRVSYPMCIYIIIIIDWAGYARIISFSMGLIKVITIEKAFSMKFYHTKVATDFPGSTWVNQLSPI